MNEKKEQMIDCIDLLIEILYKWKTIIVVTFFVTVFALVCSLFRGIVIGRRTNITDQSETSGETQRNNLVEGVRVALTEVEAQDVERVYRQYQSYIAYRNLYQEELDNYDKAFDKTGEEMLIKCTSYNITSALEGVEGQFSLYAMGIDDYRKIISIDPDVDSLANAYKHLQFGVNARNTTDVTNMGEAEDIHPTQYMITVEILGSTNEICEKVWNIVDEAFKSKQKELQAIDPDIKMELVSSNYRGNIYEYYISKKQGAFDAIQRIDTTIHNLKLYSIDKFTDDQKSYFNALLDPDRALIDQGIMTTPQLSGDDKTDINSSPIIKKISAKMIIVGVLVGLFVSLAYILFRYLCNGTIKVGEELQEYYQITVLNTFFAKDRREKGLFPGLIKKLSQVDSADVETKAAMIAADVSSHVQFMEGNSIYIVQTCDDEEDVSISSVIRQAILNEKPESQTASGQPLANVDEMQSLTHQKAALFLVHNKKTLRADVEKLLDLCNRHSIKVLGAVAITDL